MAYFKTTIYFMLVPYQSYSEMVAWNGGFCIRKLSNDYSFYLCFIFQPGFY